MDLSLFKTIPVAVSGIGAVVFAVLALGPTRAVRDKRGARLVALGGAVIFGGLTLEIIRVINLAVFVALLVASQVPVQIGVRIQLRERREEAARAQVR